VSIWGKRRIAILSNTLITESALNAALSLLKYLAREGGKSKRKCSSAPNLRVNVRERRPEVKAAIGYRVQTSFRFQPWRRRNLRHLRR